MLNFIQIGQYTWKLRTQISRMPVSKIRTSLCVFFTKLIIICLIFENITCYELYPKRMKMCDRENFIFSLKRGLDFSAPVLTQITLSIYIYIYIYTYIYIYIHTYLCMAGEGGRPISRELLDKYFLPCHKIPPLLHIYPVPALPFCLFNMILSSTPRPSK